MRRIAVGIASAALLLSGCGLASQPDIDAEDVELALTGEVGDISDQMDQWEAGAHRVPDQASCESLGNEEFSCTVIIELSAVSEEVLDVQVEEDDSDLTLTVVPTSDDFTWVTEEGSGGLLESHGTRMFGGDLEASITITVPEEER